MIHNFRNQNNTVFSLRTLEEDDLEKAISLCNECVGENLYSEKELREAMEDKNHFFYLLVTEEEEIAGYIYYYLTDLKSISDYTKIDLVQFYDIYRDCAKAVGKIQSVGLKEEYRGSGVAVWMVRFALEELKTQYIEIAVCVCWKMGEVVPLKNTLCECGFQFWKDAKKIWYDNTELICPYCKGRCLCDAEVHYRIL